MKYRIYGCGGCGINNLKLYMSTGHFKGKFDVVGLDTSGANPVDENLFPVIKVPGLEGSGGKQSEHWQEYDAFVQRVLATHEPGDVNIIINSLSGGSGGGIANKIHLELLKREIPVVSVVVGDMSSYLESINVVNSLLRLNKHTTETDLPVVFAYFSNSDAGATQTEVNKQITKFIDIFSVVFSADNTRIDYADIKNFFMFNQVINSVKISPVMTELRLLDQDGIASYEKNAVACLSIYSSEELIKQELDRVIYRKAGLNDQLTQANYLSLHAVLDHGDSMATIKEMLEKQKKSNNSIAGEFESKDDFASLKKTSSNGCDEFI